MMLAGLLALFVAQSHYTDEEANQIFSQATVAYAKGDWAASKEGFKKLLENGRGGADVLFNLGTTCLAAGELGEAVLYLERARKLESDESIEANLAIARSKQLDQVIGAQGDEPFLLRLVDSTSERWVTPLFLFCWCTGLLALLAARRWRRQRLVLTLSSTFLLGISVLTGAVVAAHVYVARTVTEAVILAPDLKARELPAETAKVSFEVHAGLKVRVMERSGRFVRVRLPNGLEAWADAQGLSNI